MVFIFSVVLVIIDVVLKVESIAKSFFESVRGEENVCGVFVNVYMNFSCVDDGLVNFICGVVNREGVFKVFVNILMGFVGSRFEEFMFRVACSMFILWGSKDIIILFDFLFG